MDRGETPRSAAFPDAFSKVEVWVDGVLGGWEVGILVGEVESLKKGY